jgi:hypothetical protein
MKKQTIGLMYAVIFCFLFSYLIPCYAADTTIHGCYNKKSGALRVVAEGGKCKKSELPISWNQQCSECSAGSSNAVKVFDAKNQYLGILTDWKPSQSTPIYVPSLKKIVRITAESGGRIANRDLFYESSDCTGTYYVQSTFFDSYYEIYENLGKYYTGTDIIPKTISVQSIKSHRYGVCINNNNLYTYYPDYWDPFPWSYAVVVGAEVTLPFTLPITYPLLLE